VKDRGGITPRLRRTVPDRPQLTAVIAASLLVYVAMRDTKHESAIGRHE